MSARNNLLEVWLDCDLGPPCRVGTLAHDRGQVYFHYEQDWLGDARAFALDPDLSLDDAPFFPKPDLGNFSIFLDSSPERWGQTLMKRREALQAKDEGRNPRALYAWDYLIGVQDLTRQGALRFRLIGTDEFLGNEAMAAPPVTTLRELESVAVQLSTRRIDDLDALRRWLAVLVAPGASAGGARPKANFTEADGSLWIAKFPALDDDRDVGAWEYTDHRLARHAGVEVPPAKLVRFNNGFHTFCAQRFDRTSSTRRFHASAMAMLRKDHSEGSSYLELAQFLRAQGGGAQAARSKPTASSTRSPLRWTAGAGSPSPQALPLPTPNSLRRRSAHTRRTASARAGRRKLGAARAAPVGGTLAGPFRARIRISLRPLPNWY